MKKGSTSGHREIRIRWAGLSDGCHSNQKLSMSIKYSWIGKWGYNIQLNKELRLTVYIWIKEQEKLILEHFMWGSSLQAVFRARKLHCRGHFLHILSTFELRLKKGFAIPLSLACASLCHSHGAETLGVIDMAVPVSDKAYTQDFTKPVSTYIHTYVNIHLYLCLWFCGIFFQEKEETISMSQRVCVSISFCTMCAETPHPFLKW